MLKFKTLDEARSGDEKLAGEFEKRMLPWRKNVVRAMSEPLLPAFCRILFTCMIVFPLLTFAFALYRAFSEGLPAWKCLAGSVVAASVSFIFFGFFVLLLSAVQLIRLHAGYAEPEYLFEDEASSLSPLASVEPVTNADPIPGGGPKLVRVWNNTDPAVKYRRYITTVLAGFAVIVLSYAAVL